MSDHKKENRYLEEMKDIVILSPHSDDACYSISGQIKNLCNSGNSIEVVTVFSRTDYVEESWFEFLNEKSVQDIRIAEDHRFADFVDSRITMSHLGHFDAPLRGYELLEIDNVMDFHEKDFGIHADLVSYLSTRILDRTVLYSPSAIGDHIDHRIVMKAVVAFLREHPIHIGRTLFYEDLPYANVGPEPRALTEEVRRAFDGQISFEDSDISPFVALKIRAITCYESQINLECWINIMERLSFLDLKERIYRIHLKDVSSGRLKPTHREKQLKTPINSVDKTHPNPSLIKPKSLQETPSLVTSRKIEV